MIPFLFFLFAAVAVVSAVVMVTHKNPVYSALFLIVTMFAISGFYVLLNAPFIAAVHVIVYAGAIMVLFLFVVMLLDLGSEGSTRRPISVFAVLGVLAAVVLVGQLGYFLFSGFHELAAPSTSGEPVVGSTKAVGQVLFTRYLFPFEITSVLLLSAIIGSVILAKQKLRS